jgi:hypothetical protein
MYVSQSRFKCKTKKQFILCIILIVVGIIISHKDSLSLRYVKLRENPFTAETVNGIRPLWLSEDDLFMAENEGSLNILFAYP